MIFRLPRNCIVTETLTSCANIKTSVRLTLRFEKCNSPMHIHIDFTHPLFEPAHGTHVWGVLGMSKCSVRTSVSVRRRALSMLLGHGVLGHEPLSVCEVA